METGYVMTYRAIADGHDLTVRIVGGTVTFTFENSAMPMMAAAIIRAKGCVASPDGVKQLVDGMGERGVRG